MRELSSTLLTAQKEASHIPYVKVEAGNTISGVVRLDWTRFYTGSEDDYFHAVTMPGDSSLIRVRVTLPADSCKLYRQRVANPGPESDFSQWVYTNQFDVTVVAATSLGAEVSIFWIDSDRKIYQLKSTDYGVNWGSPTLLGYSPTTAVYGIATAYKSNGDIVNGGGGGIAEQGRTPPVNAVVGDPDDTDTWKLPHHRKSIFRALKGRLDIERTVDWERMPAAVAALSPGGYRGQRVEASPEAILKAAKHLADHYRKANKPLPDTLAALV